MDQHHSSRVATLHSTRPTSREERHPNAVTAPPVNRGSMPQRPWRGFWNSIGTALLSGANRVLSPRARVPVRAVNKVKDGRPHIADMVKAGEIQLVYTTVDETRTAIAD